ncbi:MAG: hypothetical protein IJT69_02190 [Clostridia bacterium]|nr:hypothetical protein [Clostridia bacterium]
MGEQNENRNSKINPIVVVVIVVLFVLAVYSITSYLIKLSGGGSSDRGASDSANSALTPKYNDENYQGSNLFYDVSLSLKKDKTFSLKIEDLSTGKTKNYLGSYEYSDTEGNHIDFSFYSTGETFNCMRTSVGGENIILSSISTRFPVVYKK